MKTLLSTLNFKIQIFLFLLSISSVSCYAQTNSLNEALNGKWFIELNSNDIGTVHTLLNFETDGNTFSAYTRRNAAKDILGFWKSSLAKIFTDDFKNGSLIRITDGIIQQKSDTIVLAAIFHSSIGNYYFNGTIINDTLNAKLRNSKKELTGQLKGYKNFNIEYPLNDYPKIISEAIDTAKSKIFNRNILETKEWKEFEENIREKSTDVEDDIELVFAFYYFASELPISHFSLTRVSNEKEGSGFDSKKYLFLTELSNSTALLKITSFSGTSTEVDSIFSEINKVGYKNLIVDLRNNSGGTVEAGMAFARNVVDTTIIGGVFLTQEWFNHHNNIPNEREYGQFSIFSEANYDLIIQGIHREKGLVLKVKPNQRNYDGKLFILTNNNTASTCEPIVYSLKQSNRATVIGENTAGAMLNGEQFILPSGFSLYVPTADYYTVDGFRIDQNGIEPNIKKENKEDVVEYIMKELIK